MALMVDRVETAAEISKKKTSQKCSLRNPFQKVVAKKHGSGGRGPFTLNEQEEILSSSLQPLVKIYARNFDPSKIWEGVCVCVCGGGGGGNFAL